jgi:nucleoside-diphosphate-sugar epimerase
MNVLIIGGTRFLGPIVVNQLVGLGHQVTVFHRGQTNISLPKQVNEILGDRKNIDDFRHQFQSLHFDVVVDMFAYIEKDAIDVVKTFSSFVERFVVLSSADVYQAYGKLIGLEPGEFTKELLLEESPLRSIIYPYQSFSKEDDWRYYYDKILVEQQYMNGSPIPATILRLPMIYGPNDRQFRLTQYLKEMKSSQEIILNPIEAKWRTSRGFVENIAYAITLSIINSTAANQVYNVAEENALTEIEWVSTIKENYKWEGHIFIDENIDPSEGLNPEQHLVMSTKKIRDELGYKEIVPYKDGIQQTIAWENNNAPH